MPVEPEGSVKPSYAEQRLRFIARVQAFTAGFVVVLAIGVSTALLILAFNAQGQAERLRQEVADNCYNVEVTRQYHDTIVRLLVPFIKRQNPGPTRVFLQTFADASRTASDAMITTTCTDLQG